MLIESTGIVKYGPGIKASLIIDDNIGKYYRSLIPKYFYVKPPMYSSHITIVRTGKETPTNMDVWGKHEGKILYYEYDPIIKNDSKYYYLECYSEEIGLIRHELGLAKYRPGRDCYHITIGNIK